jgi:hypothetical protein
MKQLIIDSGFYNDPEQMKTLFVNLDFVKNENMLQGKICPMPFANDDMLRHIQNIIGVPEDISAFEFVPGSGTFISNQADELPARSICIQYPEPNTQWVGIVSLNKSDNPHYLKFYKHKRTGWDHVPMDPEELSKEKLYSYEHIESFMAFENNNWEDKWEETSRVELKPNELVLFRPWMFHSYNDVFGDSQQTARLLQFFFLKPKQDLTIPEVPSTI